MLRKNPIHVLCIFLFPILIFSQEQKKESIKLFVDCNCEKNYIRQEVNYVNHVRDQDLANVRLFIYDIANGSGGRTYKLEFSGQDSFAEVVKELTYDTNANMTSDEIRKGLVKRIELGLLKYIIDSDLSDRITFRIKGKHEPSDLELDDPWKNWIFEIYGQAKLSKESSRKKFEYKVGLESDRVTNKWRIRADFQLSQLNTKFIQDDEAYTSHRERFFGSGSIVRSLSDHWSTGVFLNASHDTYTNLDVSGGVFPAIEYNIFPYSEVLKREIVFAYKMGYNCYDYIETTIYDKDHETVFKHTFDIQLRYRQPWGNLYARVFVSSFLEDFSKNRLRMNGYLSLRVLRGFSVRFSGNLELIRDQISLPAGDASLEDVLLQQKQIATDFDLGLSVGLAYTFGSAFNNIINTRL